MTSISLLLSSLTTLSLFSSENILPYIKSKAEAKCLLTLNIIGLQLESLIKSLILCLQHDQYLQELINTIKNNNVSNNIDIISFSDIFIIDIKLLKFFDKKSASSDGYETYCKICRKTKRDIERSEKKDENKNKKKCLVCEELLKFNMFFKTDNDGLDIKYYDTCMNCYTPDSLQCNRCNNIKLKTQFSKDSTKKTGYRTICKTCTNK